MWAGVIFAMSSIPGSSVPGRGGTLAHFVEYAVFGALLYSAVRLDAPKGRALLLAVAIASVYALTDEFHQSFVPMRVPDPLDWAVDTIGAAAGAITASGIERAARRRRAANG